MLLCLAITKNASNKNKNNGSFKRSKMQKKYLFTTDDTDHLKNIQNGFYFNKRPPLISVICKAFSQEPFSQKNLLSLNKHR